MNGLSTDTPVERIMLTVLGGWLGLILLCILVHKVYDVLRTPRRVDDLICRLGTDEGRLSFQEDSLRAIGGRLYTVETKLRAISAAPAPAPAVDQRWYTCSCSTCQNRTFTGEQIHAIRTKLAGWGGRRPEGDYVVVPIEEIQKLQQMLGDRPSC